MITSRNKGLFVVHCCLFSDVLRPSLKMATRKNTNSQPKLVSSTALKCGRPLLNLWILKPKPRDHFTPAEWTEKFQSFRIFNEWLAPCCYMRLKWQFRWSLRSYILLLQEREFFVHWLLLSFFLVLDLNCCS